MLKFLLIAALVIMGIVVCVLAVAATKPSRFTVQRGVTVQATQDKVLALINDLHRWPEWSANEPDDSTVRRSYSGAAEGKGAIGEWEGTGKAGKGRIEIIESSPNVIRLQADWAKPFAARNINSFNFELQGNATRVTWTLDGENVFMLKVMAVFVSADRLMGSHLETGLASLKAAAEK
jgi:carbon monoxide dehydrogenase subunit G